jgi:hypothetical protein
MLAAQLNETARLGHAVFLVYRPDGRPQSMHAVRPISASRRVLRARDTITGEPREFLLAHIELLPETLADTPSLAAPPRSDAAKLAAIEDDLRVLGWHVLRSSDRLAVYRVPPQTNPMRLAVASLFRTPARSGARHVRRPWSVLVPGLSRASAFATLDNALELFMYAARAHAPRNRGRERSTLPAVPMRGRSRSM